MKRGGLEGDYINLAIGAPDIPPPKDVSEAISNFLSEGNYKYFNSRGSEKARKNVSTLLGLEVESIDEITLVNGAKFGIYNALNTLLNTGDAVGLFPPYWLSYPDINKILGLKTVFFDSHINESNDLYYSLEEVKKSIAENNIRCIIINDPNNPSGQLFDQILFDDLLKFCAEEQIWVIVDEVYKDLIFEEGKPLTFDIKKFENIVKVGSLSKSLSVPGLRAGYVQASKEVISNFNLINQHISTCINSLTDYVLGSILKESFDSYIHETSKVYQRRYELASKILTEKGYKFFRAYSGFYMLVKVVPKYESGEIAAEELQKEGVLVTPGKAYGEDFNDYIRLCLTVNEEMLIKAFLKF